MGKKKRSHPDIEEILSRPWCYYCERDFDDLKILISHQKAKHYKCDRCGRRLNTAGGLSVHMNQVHKENLTTVENALPNRSAADIEIFGMEGIPEDILQAHNQRISHEFFAAEAERRAISGNPAPGGSSGNQQGAGSGVKKPKFESPADLKKRLAEHKARKAAEAGGSVSSDPNTPGQTATPPVYQPPFPAPSAASPAQSAFPAPFSQSLAPVAAVPPPAPFYGAQQSPPFNYGDAFGGAPSGPAPGAFPPAGQFHVPPHFSPAPQQQYGDNPAFPPQYQAYQPQGAPAPHVPQHASSPFGQHNPRLPPASPAPPAQQPQRQASLPNAPGLPQRPSFNAPHVSREQLAEMHHGNTNAAGEAQPTHTTARPAGNANPQSVDDLISNAAQQSTQSPTTQTPAAATPTPAPEKSEKKTDGESKKSKKASRLVFPEQDASPEEKMSGTAKYGFTPPKDTERILGPVEGNMTGVVQGPDTVLDPSDR